MNDNPSTVTISKSSFVLLQREANINNRPLARHLLSIGRYLGVGTLVHAWFLGGVFAPESAWSWGYVLAWPVPLLFWFIGAAVIWILYAVIVIVVCAAIWWGAVEVCDRRERLRRERDFFGQDR